MNSIPLEKKKYRLELTKIAGDLITPVECYLKIRSDYALAFLLENSLVHDRENSFSYVAFDALSQLSVYEKEVQIRNFTDLKKVPVGEDFDLSALFRKYLESFEVEGSSGHSYMLSGLFGYTSYDCVSFVETLKINHNQDYPFLNYVFFRNIIVFDHYHDEIYLIEHLSPGEKSKSSEIAASLRKHLGITYPFSVSGPQESNFTDKDFLQQIERAKYHIKRGDVFQLVLSRRFSKKFQGDDFELYRKLRMINPSPYLYYMDFGGFRVFGSSPEAQIMIRKNMARVFPIAGTYKRGEKETDEALSDLLMKDYKENAEHFMLVDLARNDLSKKCREVHVERLMQIEKYSHVIHLVSEIKGEISEGHHPVDVMFDTFPAGTLSGAPKYRAMELINELEPTPRGLYGGAVGYVGFNGDINHAICIRSFISKNGTLYYQAGCGIVYYSEAEKELNEVYHKIGALNQALKTFETEA